jgi:hypothetical protein
MSIQDQISDLLGDHNGEVRAIDRRDRTSMRERLLIGEAHQRRTHLGRVGTVEIEALDHLDTVERAIEQGRQDVATGNGCLDLAVEPPGLFAVADGDV